MTADKNRNGAERIRVGLCCGLVAVTALIMGAPTLRGGFVGGDDHRLVLDHVLVNHPSWEHALKLFTIPHRDLYQPLPLLSFSAEFAIAIPLGLFDKSVEKGAWLFHLTNVVLHALNALLVFAVLTRLVEREADAATARVVAAVAGVLFAAHPINMEVVAWINGRMMLLSTLFALSALVVLFRWMKTGEHRWALLAILCVACCGLSKIRISLPLLLLLVPLCTRRRPTGRSRPTDQSNGDLRTAGILPASSSRSMQAGSLRYEQPSSAVFWFLWAACAAITVGLGIVNYTASSAAGMFSGAEENLHGPPIVRALLGLGWYLTHLVWPVGLASWYPTPTLVRWSDPATLYALVLVAAALVVAVWAATRTRIAWYGFGWFFVTIASTLQLIPNRNVLAADRYMYLPVIGLLLVVAWAVYRLYVSAVQPAHIRPARLVRAGALVLSLMIVSALIATSWQVGSFYESPIKKSERITHLFPDTPRVWERLAWAYHRAGRHQDAILAANRELMHDDRIVRSEAHQIIGTAKLAQALESRETRPEQVKDALETLKLAREEDPDNPMADYRLAVAFEELGRFEEALPLYEETARRAPLSNPNLHRLGRLYRQLERTAAARRTFDQILENNAYDVKAIMALAEMDIEDGSAESLAAARQRLESLLDWMPENADAWANLGVVFNGLGLRGDAIEAYQRALVEQPTQATAALNLALIYDQAGDAGRAAALFERAVASGLESVQQVLAVHDFLVARGFPHRAVALWRDQSARFPDSPKTKAFEAWALALAGRISEASATVGGLKGAARQATISTATSALIAVVNGETESALALADTLCQGGAEVKDARDRLLRALESYDQRNPGNPATYCLTARLLTADGQTEAARVFTDLCGKYCDDPECQEQVIRLKANR